MKVIILAAGEGTRLRPYTLERPKCMVPVDGASLLERQLAVLHACGLDDITLIGGYRADMLPTQGLTIRTNPRYFETNMVWTLFCAEPDLAGDVIIAYGDIVYSAEILRALLADDHDIAVTIDHDWEAYWRARAENPLDDAETLKIDADGNLTEIGQPPTSLAEIQGQYMGLMKFSAEGIEQLKSEFHRARDAGGIRGKPAESAYMTDLLQLLIDNGHALKAVGIHGGWVEVDTVSDLESTVTHERLRHIAGAL